MLRRMWQTSPELIATAVVMPVILIGAIVGLIVDPRIITGAPAWLKPAKFAISVALTAATLAVLLRWLQPLTGGVRRAVTVISVLLAGELGVEI